MQLKFKRPRIIGTLHLLKRHPPIKRNPKLAIWCGDERCSWVERNLRRAQVNYKFAANACLPNINDQVSALAIRRLKCAKQTSHESVFPVAISTYSLRAVTYFCKEKTTNDDKTWNLRRGVWIVLSIPKTKLHMKPCMWKCEFEISQKSSVHCNHFANINSMMFFTDSIWIEFKVRSATKFVVTHDVFSLKNQMHAA